MPPEDGVYSFAAVITETASGYPKPEPIKIDGQLLEFTQQEYPPNVWFTKTDSTLQIGKLKRGQLYKLEVD